MDRLFPSAEGTGFAVRRATGCGVPHQRLSALSPLGWGTSQTAAGRTVPRNGGVCSMRHAQRQAASHRLAIAGSPAFAGDDDRGLKRRGVFWRNEPEKAAASVLAKRTRGHQRRPSSSGIDPEKWKPVFGQDHAPTKDHSAGLGGPVNRLDRGRRGGAAFVATGRPTRCVLRWRSS